MTRTDGRAAPHDPVPFPRHSARLAARAGARNLAAKETR
jgi:hypothetical protein